MFPPGDEAKLPERATLSPSSQHIQSNLSPLNTEKPLTWHPTPHSNPHLGDPAPRQHHSPPHGSFIFGPPRPTPRLHTRHTHSKLTNPHTQKNTRAPQPWDPPHSQPQTHQEQGDIDPLSPFNDGTNQRGPESTSISQLMF